MESNYSTAERAIGTAVTAVLLNNYLRPRADRRLQKAAVASAGCSLGFLAVAALVLALSLVLLAVSVRGVRRLLAPPRTRIERTRFR